VPLVATCDGVPYRSFPRPTGMRPERLGDRHVSTPARSCPVGKARRARQVAEDVRPVWTSKDGFDLPGDTISDYSSACVMSAGS